MIESRFETLNAIQKEINDKDKVIEDLTNRIIKLEERIELNKIMTEKSPSKSPEILKTPEAETVIAEVEINL